MFDSSQIFFQYFQRIHRYEKENYDLLVIFSFKVSCWRRTRAEQRSTKIGLLRLCQRKGVFSRHPSDSILWDEKIVFACDVISSLFASRQRPWKVRMMKETNPMCVVVIDWTRREWQNWEEVRNLAYRNALSSFKHKLKFDHGGRMLKHSEKRWIMPSTQSVDGCVYTLALVIMSSD